MILNELGDVCIKKPYKLTILIEKIVIQLGLKIKQSPLLQNLLRDSVGPSSKT